MEKVSVSLENKELTMEERNLLCMAYKNVIGARRASWRIISSIEQKEGSRGNEDHVSVTRDYRAKIETELSSICDGILKVLDSKVIPVAKAGNSKCLYLKMKGDYHRYLDEFKTGGRLCTHCGESGHSKQKCYEIIGYPDWWNFQKKPRKNIGTNVVNFTEAKQGQPTANVVHPGIIGKTSAVSVISKNSSWIIDTGASDHMTKDPGNLNSSKPCSRSIIYTANDSTSPITGEGSVILNDSLTLDTVLIVPSLAYNLLSVSQITATLKCTVTFWPQFCVFQDILTRKILGYGVRRDNMYFLELTEKGGSMLGHAHQTRSKDQAHTLVWLWHRRLGHLSFGYLKRLQPHLFSSLSILDFQCEICKLVKSHRISYLLSLHKSVEPFAVIHSDVWGPA